MEHIVAPDSQSASPRIPAPGWKNTRRFPAGSERVLPLYFGKGLFGLPGFSSRSQKRPRDSTGRREGRATGGLGQADVTS